MCPKLSREISIEYQDDFSNESIYDAFEDLAPNLDYVFHECRWQQQKINCFDFLSPVLSFNGLCFAFNALSSHDMYTDR